MLVPCGTSCPARASSVILRERKSRDVGGEQESVQAETSRRRSERRYNSYVAHPDVILHHLITSLNGPCQEFEGYVGKLDLDKVEPESFRDLLKFQQQNASVALSLEGYNASGGTEHPPYHFDFLEVTRGIANAHAFQHDGFAFIVMTQPLVELLLNLTFDLSQSPPVRQLFGISAAPVDRDGIHLALFQLQFDFLLGHEYTHHVHRHCAPEQTLAVRTEFLQEEEDGSLEQQAQELDADGYSSYLLLANLLQDENRYASVLEGLGHAAHRSAASDELLFTAFFVVVLNVFCAFWRKRTEVAALYKLVHPPPPVRINNIIQVAQMFAGQNGPVEDSWFQPSRFTELFRTAAATIPGSGRQTWDRQMALLRSPDGERYAQALFDMFEAARKKIE